MRRSRVVDGAGVVLVAMALLIWWLGLPDRVDPALESWQRDPLVMPAGAARVSQVARQVLLVLLITGSMAALGVAATGWRSRLRPVVVAPFALVVAGLAAVQLVTSVLYRSELLGTPHPVLAGLTPRSAVTATLVASVGLALLLAAAPPRPLAVVAGLLGVAAVARVAEEVLLWWLSESRGLYVAALHYLVVHALVALLTVAGLLAVVAGLRRPSGSPAREAAVGATVLWGSVALAMEILSPPVWQAGPPPFGTLRQVLDPTEPFTLGVVSLLVAPAAAVLVARTRARPGREVVAMRWRGACAALALLLAGRAVFPLGLVLAVWPGQEIVTPRLVLWLVLSAAAAVGFALAADRRDGAPVIAVLAALLAVSSVGVGPGIRSDPSGGATGWLPEPLVLGMLAPLVVALSLALRSLVAHRGGGEPEPAETSETSEPSLPV